LAEATVGTRVDDGQWHRVWLVGHVGSSDGLALAVDDSEDEKDALLRLDSTRGGGNDDVKLHAQPLTFGKRERATKKAAFPLSGELNEHFTFRRGHQGRTLSAQLANSLLAKRSLAEDEICRHLQMMKIPALVDNC